MKMKLFGMAAASLLATSAYALPPTSTPTVTVYAAGGSAQQRVAAWAMDQLMTNIDVYSPSGCNGAQSSTYQIAFGTLRVAQGAIPAGTPVLMYYRFTGGSFPNGVGPQALLSTLPYPSAISAGVACAGQAYPLPTYSIAATPTVNQVPDWGLSDEEPALFNAAFNVPGTYSGTGAFTQGTTLTAAQVGSIQSSSLFSNVFGIAISNNLATAACPKTNFSKLEMAGILSGAIQDWGDLQGDGGCAITAGPITLVDRAPGSGTKAAGSLFFLNYPLAGGLNPGNVTNGITIPAGTTCNNAYNLVNAGSNGAVVSLLNNANQNRNQAGALGTTPSCRAVAILSGEFPPALNPTVAVGTVVAGAAGYRFASIDGVDSGFNVAPGGTITYANALSGAYPFIYTNAFNTHTLSSAPNATLRDAIRTALQQPTVAAGAGGNSLSASGILLDPAISPSFGRCVARASHNGLSVTPLSFFYPFSVPLPVPGCVDPV